MSATTDEKFVKITVRNPDSRMDLANLCARAALQAQKKLAADGYANAIEVGVSKSEDGHIVVLVQAKRTEPSRIVSPHTGAPV